MEKYFLKKANRAMDIVVESIPNFRIGWLVTGTIIFYPIYVVFTGILDFIKWIFLTPVKPNE